MNNNQRKEKILADIATAREQGYTLIQDDWGLKIQSCACALGCVNVANGTRPDDQEYGGVAEVLGVDQKWLYSFMDGFDDNGNADGASTPEAWQLGADIRKETNPISYAEFVDKMDTL